MSSRRKKRNDNSVRCVRSVNISKVDNGFSRIHMRLQTPKKPLNQNIKILMTKVTGRGSKVITRTQKI